MGRADGLFREKYQVLTVDLPEHGESIDTVLPSYRVEAARNR